MTEIEAHMATQLSNIIRGSVRSREPLAPWTTMAIGGPAQLLAYPEDTDDLKGCLAFARGHSLAVRVLGKGSNLLVGDEGIDGLVVSLAGSFNHLEIQGTRVLVGAALPLAVLVTRTIRLGLSGLEELVGIPGTVGGALAMNAGAGGAAIGQRVEKVRLVGLDGEETCLDRLALNFRYRGSVLQDQPLIATRAELRLDRGSPASLAARARELMARRRRTQPLDRPNAGSIFRNPPGSAAGLLIERTGLKGARAGAAQVSEKHANFIVNLGGARAADVLALMARVYATVAREFSIHLEPEIKIWRRGGEPLPWVSPRDREPGRGVSDATDHYQRGEASQGRG